MPSIPGRLTRVARALSASQTASASSGEGKVRWKVLKVRVRKTMGWEVPVRFEGRRVTEKSSVSGSCGEGAMGGQREERGGGRTAVAVARGWHHKPYYCRDGITE